MALFKFEWKTWKTLDALNSFGRYWRKSEELINQDADIEEILNPPHWEPQNDAEQEEYRAEVDQVRSFHDSTMKRNLRYACTALLYSLVEVELDRFIINLDTQRLKPKKRQSYLEAFSERLNKHSLDVHSIKQYSTLEDISSVRHCIVHCWGEMKLGTTKRVKTRLLKISDLPNRGILCPETGKIEVDYQFLEQTLIDSRIFFLELFRWTGWTVDDIWLRKQP